MNHMLKQEVADKMRELIEPMEPGSGSGRILEIGTGWAESAEFFSALKPKWKIYTIDGFGLYGDGRIYSRMDHDAIYAINSRLQKLGNVIQILGDSAFVPWELPIDALFLDGGHTYEATLADFINFSPWVVAGGIIIFDDYTQENNPANGVKKVVDEIMESYGIGEIGREKWELIYKGYYCAILMKTSASVAP